MKGYSFFVAPLFISLGISGSALAAAYPVVDPLPEGSFWARAAGLPKIYQNNGNPWLQELSVTGQLQVQYAHGSSNCGNFGTGDMPDNVTWGDLEVRRFRLGMKARFLEQFRFFTLLDLEPDLSPRYYKRTAETYFTWAPDDAFWLSFGKTELKFTREQEISSREILTLERSQLVNMFYGGELVGTWISGKGIAGGWFYELGVYDNVRTDEFSYYNGGTMILGKIGCDYTGQTSFDKAVAEFHYLHNSHPGYSTPGNPSSPLFSDCIALSNEITEGRMFLSTEMYYGAGDLDQGDVWGITVMPTYYLTDKLQCVANFQLAGSNESDGISQPSRYECLAPGGGSGDAYFAGYAGLDYYFHGHMAKVITGVKYSRMTGGDEDFRGWTFQTGLRLAF